MNRPTQHATWRDVTTIRKPDGYSAGEQVWAEIAGTWTTVEVVATSSHGVTISYRDADGVQVSTQVRTRYVIHPDDLDGDE